MGKVTNDNIKWSGAGADTRRSQSPPGALLLRFDYKIQLLTTESLLESNALKILSSMMSSVMSRVVWRTSLNLNRSIFPPVPWETRFWCIRKRDRICKRPTTFQPSFANTLIKNCRGEKGQEPITNSREKISATSDLMRVEVGFLWQHLCFGQVLLYQCFLLLLLDSSRYAL